MARVWARGVHNLLFVYYPAKPDRDYYQAFHYRFPGVDGLSVPLRSLLLSALLITLGWRAFVMTWQQVPHYTSVLPWLDLLPGTLFTFMVGYSLNFLPENVSRRVAVAGLLAATVVFLALLQWQLILNEVYWTGH